MTAINVSHQHPCLTYSCFFLKFAKFKNQRATLSSQVPSFLSAPFLSPSTLVWNNFHLMITDFIQSINTGQNYIILLGIQQNLTWWKTAYKGNSHTEGQGQRKEWGKGQSRVKLRHEESFQERDFTSNSVYSQNMKWHFSRQITGKLELDFKEGMLIFYKNRSYSWYFCFCFLWMLRMFFCSSRMTHFYYFLEHILKTGIEFYLGRHGLDMWHWTWSLRVTTNILQPVKLRAGETRRRDNFAAEMPGCFLEVWRRLREREVSALTPCPFS